MPAARVSLEAVLRTAEAPRTGALWKLDGAARQLDANLVRLPSGAGVTEHVEPDLDVLLVVVEGSGSLHHAGDEEELAPGALVFVPRGERRSVTAGADGLAYLTAHRRRPGLTIGGTQAREGGEPACLLGRICPACGRVSEDPSASYCGRCGGRLPAA
ncbi:cupin domain-containing protein [Streptomyces sp. NPDC058067]|uniref:cupin domain-containing protein n=1 Tax=Streptomyces sp. NPDC058067 TaxID=3346324 RepID=UPI0036E37531